MNFNYEAIINIIYLDLKPTLHIIDANIAFQTARFVNNVLTKRIQEVLKTYWINIYLDPPNIVIDILNTKFVPLHFKIKIYFFGIIYNQIPIEAY